MRYRRYYSQKNKDGSRTVVSQGLGETIFIKALGWFLIAGIIYWGIAAPWYLLKIWHGWFGIIGTIFVALMWYMGLIAFWNSLGDKKGKKNV